MDRNGDNDWIFHSRLPTVVLPRRRLRPRLWRVRPLPLAVVTSVVVGLIAPRWLWVDHNKTSSTGVVRELPAHDSEATNTGVNTDETLTAITGSAQIANDACHVNSPAPQLVVSTPPTVLRPDQPAPLGLTVERAPDGAQLVICGFATRSVFSAGQAIDENTWTVPVSEVKDATLMPPRGFVGSMDLAVLLVLANRSLADHKTLHLQWLAQIPTVHPISAPHQIPTARQIPAVHQMPTVQRNDFPDLDKLLAYGTSLKTAGNLADARLIFHWIAETGDPRAAFMLAETYDPIALAKRPLLPVDSDIALARIWYRKASDFGSQDAPGRLERLANW
jgi:hypothetical protein